MESDLGIHDDFHGTDGPMPVRRRQSGAWPDIQKAFHDACLQMGFGATEDTNGPNLSGVRSPQLLMLSGIGPKDQLERFGIPLIHELPGVGQNLWNHLSAHVTFKVKDGKTLATDLDAPHFSLHYTSQGSGKTNDMVLRTSTVVDEREERVAGVRTMYLTGDVPPDRSARISCTLGLPKGSGYVRLVSADPNVQPSFNYRYLQYPNDIRRVREGLRFGLRLLESDAYKDVLDHLISPTEDFWPTTTLWTSGYARPWGPPRMYPGPAGWVLIQTPWRWSINTAGSRECKGCGWPISRYRRGFPGQAVSTPRLS